MSNLRNISVEDYVTYVLYKPVLFFACCSQPLVNSMDGIPERKLEQALFQPTDSIPNKRPEWDEFNMGSKHVPRSDEHAAKSIRVGVTDRKVSAWNERLSELDSNTIQDRGTDDENGEQSILYCPVGCRIGEGVSQRRVGDEVTPLIEWDRIGFASVDNSLGWDGDN